MPTTPAFHTLLDAARGGDEDAFDALLSRFYPRVQAMVHQSLGRELRGKRPWLLPAFSTGDVVQEVFRSVVRDLDSFSGDNEASFVSYLSTLINNRLIDAIRFHEAVRRDRRRARGEVEDLVGPGGSRAPDHHAADAEDIQRFCRVLSTFPTRERTLLRQRIEQERTFAELAQDCAYPSADSARKAFYAAQSLLLLRLQAAGVTDRETSL